MKALYLKCDGCDKDYTVGERDRDEDGNVNIPTLQCDFCEAQFCADQCFRLHDCPGHDAEIVLCMSCLGECELSKDAKGREMTRPALLDGDPYCAKCVYLKPWEKKEKKIAIKTTVHYFDKAS